VRKKKVADEKPRLNNRMLGTKKEAGQMGKEPDKKT